MTDRDALLAAICADPADDAPRLICADWLDEHGEPERAEFIRAQCKLARAKPCFGHTVSLHAEDCRYCWLQWKEVRLWDDRWFEPPPAFPSRGGLDWYRRGFVASIRCDATDWLAHGDALSWHPDSWRPCPPTAQPIEEVRLTTWPTILGSNPDDGQCWIEGDSRRLNYRDTIIAGDGDRSGVLGCLLLRWPAVRAWNLPPGPATLARVHEGLFTR